MGFWDFFPYIFGRQRDDVDSASGEYSEEIYGISSFSIAKIVFTVAPCILLSALYSQ